MGLISSPSYGEKDLRKIEELPSGPVVKNSMRPMQRSWFDPWSGKMMYAAWRGQKENK